MALEVYHLSHRMSGRPEIRIIGIPHGGITTQMPQAVSEHLSSFFRQNPQFQGLTEGVRNTSFGRIVTNSQVPGVRAIEPPLIRLMTEWSVYGAIWKLGLRRTWQGINEERKDAKNRENQTVTTTHLPPKPAEEIRAKNEMREVKSVGPTVGLMINVRSALMAAEALKQVRQNMKAVQEQRPVALIVGSQHVGQIHRFLENPRLARAYLGRIRNPLGESVPTPLRNQVHAMLDRADNEFRILQQKKSAA